MTDSADSTGNGTRIRPSQFSGRASPGVGSRTPEAVQVEPVLRGPSAAAGTRDARLGRDVLRPAGVERALGRLPLAGRGSGDGEEEEEEGGRGKNAGFMGDRRDRDKSIPAGTGTGTGTCTGRGTGTGSMKERHCHTGWPLGHFPSQAFPVLRSAAAQRLQERAQRPCRRPCSSNACRQDVREASGDQPPGSRRPDPVAVGERREEPHSQRPRPNAAWILTSGPAGAEGKPSRAR